MHIPTDPKGYLTDLSLWDEKLAEIFAAREQLELTAAHWEIIYLLRNFYQAYQRSPTMRVLTKLVNEQLGQDKANSIYLFKLFPLGPVQQAAKIAGLPKPAHCL